MERRQSMTTWGMLALAVFVSVGMAEWSKRTAAGEKVISPEVMKEALKIAAAAGSGSRVVGGELPNLESGKRPSFAANPLHGAATEGFESQTSAGVEK